MNAKNREYNCAKPIAGAATKPKEVSAGGISNAVALKPRPQGLAKIKGAVSGPK